MTKELERLLSEEKMKSEREARQKVIAETQMKGIDAQLAQAKEENARLQAELDKRYTGPVMLPVADCEDCPQLISKLEHLDIKLHQKDVMIESLIRYRDHPRTNKLYDESRAWSKEYLRQGSPLYYLEME